MTPKRVLIAGWPKSGTTALAYKVRGGLQDPYWMFEPKGSLESALPSDRPAVAKILFGGAVGIEDYASYAKAFPLQVWIARDPRDVMVSKFLWHVSSGAFDHDLTTIALEWLEEKVRSPRSLPLNMIVEDPRFASTQAHVGSIVSRARNTSRLLEQYDLFQFLYEDMVEGRWGELEAYLGFDVDRDRDPARRHELVARTKSYGGWRRWFTPEDVDRYRPHLDPVLRQFGYTTDWELDDAPELTDEDPVAYVRTRLAR